MTVASYSIRSYRDTFTDRISEVESGQTHILTKHGRPCAKIVPIVGKRNVPAAIAAIRASRVKGGGNQREAIAEGRL